MQRRPLLGLLAGALAVPAIHARAQAAYPDRPIRMIVPFPAGGGTDIWARMVTELLAPELGGTIVIENRTGAGGMVGTEAAAKAVPDGYTLLFTITTHIQTPVVLRRFPYDPVADFAPIGRLGTTNLIFCVGPAVPAGVTTLAEFVAWGRGRDLNLGSYAQGSTGHAHALLLAREAGLKATQVAYRGEAPMLQDLLAGSFHGSFHSMAGSGEVIRDGRIRPLASSGEARVPSLPQVPTLLELGYSRRFAFTGFVGMLAPARVPQPILDRLDAAFRAVATRPDLHRRLLAIDTIPGYEDPATFRATIERLLRQWTELAAELNLMVEG